MNPPLLLRRLILILTAWVLSGCQLVGPATPPSIPTVARALRPTSTQQPTLAATAVRAESPAPATSVATAVTGPSDVAPAPVSPTATRTPTPSASPTLVPTPMPTLPPPGTPIVGEPLDFSLGWRLDANGHLAAAAIDLTGSQPRFSIASLGRTVYRLNGSGVVRWRARTMGPVYALALLADGRLAVGDDAAAVTVLDSSGRAVWRADLDSRVTALHATPDGQLLAGGWDERLSLIDAEGRLRWQVDVGAPVSGITALPAGDTWLALVTALNGEVRAFTLRGEEVWRFDAGSALAGVDTVLSEGQILALLGVQDGRLLALDASGATRWERALGTGAPEWHAAAQLDGGRPGLVAGTGGTSPALALLSSDNGQVRWHIRLPAPAAAITGLDLDADGELEILAGLADGQVQAYDLQGRFRGAVDAGLPVWGLYPAGEDSALILADVAAWQLVGRQGSAGGPWLPPPAMLPAPTNVPPPAAEADLQGGTLVFLGDVAFGRSMETQLARYGPAYPWQGLGPLLHGEDPEGRQLPVLTIVNLECSLTTQGEPLDKSYLIRAHPIWARSLIAGGIDLVTLANNHVLDFGVAGLEETVQTLRALGIQSVGAGTSSEAARRPVFLDLGGVRVAFLSYAAARWDGSVDVPATDRLAWARPGDIQADVQAVREQADIVAVLLHAGTEYAATPSADQIAAAHAAVDAGADLVVGHHPHVTQTVERYRQGLIVYSLGDAVFDIPRAAAMRGQLLRVRVTTAGLEGAELWPFWIEGAIQPRLLDNGQGIPLTEQIYP